MSGRRYTHVLIDIPVNIPHPEYYMSHWRRQNILPTRIVLSFCLSPNCWSGQAPILSCRGSEAGLEGSGEDAERGFADPEIGSWFRCSVEQYAEQVIPNYPTIP